MWNQPYLYLYPTSQQQPQPRVNRLMVAPLTPIDPLHPIARMWDSTSVRGDARIGDTVEWSPEARRILARGHRIELARPPRIFTPPTGAHLGGRIDLRG